LVRGLEWDTAINSRPSKARRGARGRRRAVKKSRLLCHLRSRKSSRGRSRRAGHPSSLPRWLKRAKRLHARSHPLTTSELVKTVNALEYS